MSDNLNYIQPTLEDIDYTNIESDIEIKAEKPQEPYSIIYTALVRSPLLQPNEWRVYCVLLTYAGFEKIFPTQDELARKSGLARKTVIAIIARLEEIGLIKSKPHTNRFGGKSANTYTVTDYKKWSNDNTVMYSALPVAGTTDTIYIPQGYITIPNSLLFNEELTASELRTYCVLLSYAYKGTNNPTYEQIGENVGVSGRKALDTVNKLEKMGLIKKSPSGVWCSPNSYTVNKLQ
jgi:DNA-binding MarR family transcriptional regulator